MVYQTKFHSAVKRGSSPREVRLVPRREPHQSYSIYRGFVFDKYVEVEQKT